MISLPTLHIPSQSGRLAVATQPQSPSGISTELPGANTATNPRIEQQNLEAWLADLVGRDWQERKGLQSGTAADPGLQESLSKQVQARGVGHWPTSAGCRDNIDATNPQSSTTVIRATDHHHQQTFSPELIDRRRSKLTQHFAGQPPHGLSRRG